MDLVAGQRPILLVEDNVNDVLLIQRAFQKARITHPLQVLQDGDTAVSYLSGEGDYADRILYPLPVLMLLDLKLPCRSGLEILEWLRQQSDLRRLPVVVLTSSDEMKDIHQAYDLGANSYMVKPLLFSELEVMLRTLHLYWLTYSRLPS